MINTVSIQRSLVLLTIMSVAFLLVLASVPRAHAETYRSDTFSSSVSSSGDLEALQEKIKSLLSDYKTIKSQMGESSSHSSDSSGASRYSGKIPSAVCSYKWEGSIARGSRGDDVSNLQTYLQAEGFLKDTPSGYFGSATEAAVKAYQAKYSIVSTGDAYTTGFGAVGNQTKEMIKKRCQGDSATSTAYTLSDVKSVTKKSVDPRPQVADDEHTLYTITLNNGKVHKVKVGFMSSTGIEQAFRKTGYTGDVQALMDKAVAETSSGSSSASGSLDATPATGEAPLAVTFEVTASSGKTFILDFGDRMGKKVVKGDDEVTHTYRKAGTYTAKLYSGGSSSYRSLIAARQVLDTVVITVSEDDDDDTTASSTRDFEVSVVSGKKVEASFTLPNPCTGYSVNWGDGASSQKSTSRTAICASVLDEVELTHTYREAGTYSVKLKVLGESETKSITVQ